MHELAEQIVSHLRSIWRHRWYAVGFAWVAAVAGWIVVHYTPNRYEASARVYVDVTRAAAVELGLFFQPFDARSREEL